MSGANVVKFRIAVVLTVLFTLIDFYIQAGPLVLHVGTFIAGLVFISIIKSEQKKQMEVE